MPTDTKQSLITLRFEGPAFERSDLPANALRELADFQEAFVAVAAEVWRARHSEDAQLPEGFAEALEPRVRSLGSAGAEFGCAAAANGETIALDARDLLLAALREGAAGRCHPDLGWRTLGQLSKLGETLGDNDSLIAYTTSSCRSALTVKPARRSATPRNPSGSPTRPPTATCSSSSSKPSARCPTRSGPNPRRWICGMTRTRTKPRAASDDVCSRPEADSCGYVVSLPALASG